MENNITINNVINSYSKKGIKTIPFELNTGKPVFEFNSSEIVSNQKENTYNEQDFNFETHGIMAITGEDSGNLEAIRITGERTFIEKLIGEITQAPNLHYLFNENKVSIIKHVKGFDILYKIRKGNPNLIKNMFPEIEDLNFPSNISIKRNSELIEVAPTEGFDVYQSTPFPSEISMFERNTILVLLSLFYETQQKYVNISEYGLHPSFRKIHNVYNKTKESSSIIKQILRNDSKWERVSKNIWSTLNNEGRIIFAYSDFEKGKRFVSTAQIGILKPFVQYSPFDFLVLLMYHGDYVEASKNICSILPKADRDIFEQQTNLLNNLKLAYIPFEENYQEPEPYIYINSDNEKSIIGSANNISVISGKAKAGKSILINHLISSAYSDSGVFKFGSHIKDGKIVYFDTEQSRNQSIKINNRITKASNQKKELLTKRFELFNITKHNYSTRIDLIEEKIYSDKSIAVVIIDGIRDLTGNINNPEEVSNLTNRLLKWKDENPIHIMVVIHENKGNSYLRGHLGTELTNKAETIISLSKKSDVIRIKCQASRNKSFDAKAFKILDDAMLENIEEYSGGNEGAKIEELSDKDHLKLLQFIYNDAISYNYTNLWKQIKTRMLTIFGISIGDNKAKKLLIGYREKSLIKLRDKKYVFDLPFEL